MRVTKCAKLPERGNTPRPPYKLVPLALKNTLFFPSKGLECVLLSLMYDGHENTYAMSDPPHEYLDHNQQ